MSNVFLCSLSVDAAFEEFGCSKDSEICFSRKPLQSPNNVSTRKLLLEHISLAKDKPIDVPSSTHTEIFSDLQHFVEATLIAASADNGKIDSINVTDGTSRETVTESVTGTSSNVSKASSGTCTNKDISDSDNDIIDVDNDTSKLTKSNIDTCSDMTNVSQTVIGTCSDIIDTIEPCSVNKDVIKDTSNDVLGVNKSYRGTSQNIGMDLNVDGLKPEITEIHTVDKSEPGTSKLSKVTSGHSDPSEYNKIENNVIIDKYEVKSEHVAKGRKKKSQTKRNINICKSKVPKRTKGGVGIFYCKECDCTFRLYGAYKNHKRDGKCLFECEYCGKTFTARYYSNYQSHLKYHVKDRPHKCNVCDKTYIEAQTLKIHMRKHTGVRPYVCHQCGRQFYSSSHLLSHKHSAHSDTREYHQCDICAATLSTVGNLRVHKKVVHAVERPFTCEICGKSFKTQKSLEQVHAKVHSQDYAFKCDFVGCGKMFKRSEGLADHIRRHNNERSHFCERCGKGFYTNKDLLLHTRTHTGEKPHICQLCDYKCALAGNLRKHMKTHQSAK